jgi:uncharacterized protein with NAD-binding domain and iron-sulfur cluster
MSVEKERIAILGGGLGSLITAMELTSGPNKDRYEITIYQNGWRLGGKGASGRNAAHHQRIEEHGLHIWFGCYENAFRLFRGVLEEWDIPANHPWNVDGPANRWRHAFKTADYSAVVERLNNRVCGGEDPEQRGDWELWEFVLPTRDNGEPGDGQPLYEDFWSLLGSVADSMLGYADRGEGEHRRSWDRADKRQRGFFGVIGTLIALPFRLWRLLRAWNLPFTLGRLLGPELFDHPDQSLRKLGILLNLGWAIAWGLICNWWSISRRTLDAIDHWEMRDFLRHYGAAEETVISPVISSIYDAVFAQVGGDPRKENLAAGVGLRSMLRILLGYKHSMFYKMQAGMGDTIFTPLYQVLERRGVQFRFFHQVKALELSADRSSIASVRVGRQVTLKSNAAYDPLVQVLGLGCWPSEPCWEQIDDAEAAAIQAGGFNLEHASNGWTDVEEFRLHARASAPSGTADGCLFDRVVLGISLGAFPEICGELIAANPRFAAMVKNVLTVRTEAYQLWMKTDLAGLGWPGASPVFGNFVDPMNTWSDMTHLLPREEIAAETGIQNIAYLCGPMPDAIDPDPASVTAHVRQSASAVVEALAQSFWPGSAGAGGQFKAELVAMDYIRGNVNPSDRYVLSVAGSTEFRLRPDESGFSNLTLTGDYTRNGWNAGCVEATVMGGMLASHLISGFPAKEDIAYVDGP